MSPERPGGPVDERRLRPTSPRSLVIWAIAGLVGGWLLHRLLDRWGSTPPLVTWAQPAALLLVAVILGVTAHATWRSVQRGDLLEPHQAVNRLVLARACAYVGALAAGGYLGYALSWIGSSADLAGERMWRSLAAAVAGILVVVAALLLERACRVPHDPDRDATAGA